MQAIAGAAHLAMDQYQSRFSHLSIIRFQQKQFKGIFRSWRPGMLHYHIFLCANLYCIMAAHSMNLVNGLAMHQNIFKKLATQCTTMHCSVLPCAVVVCNTCGLEMCCIGPI